ncbi:MAG: exopolysaccharide biosynthesis polyprenyl glycosylphosphotransferase [Clostridia bacterium]|nr:exopolysaccharide biosynthesis polyprenyl glycosylphosphotransferase [Clostridia bacterium]
MTEEEEERWRRPLEMQLRQRRQRRTALLNVLIRAVVYGGCLALFFLLMGVNNWPLRHLSRTSGTTLLTWCAMGAAMMAVYGKLDLGQHRRAMICAQGLGCMVTDIVTYVQLQIMNVNPNNHDRLILFGEDFLWLVLCVVLQGVVITLAVCLGNAWYHRLNPPQRALLILADPAQEPRYRACLHRERRRYRIDAVCLCGNPDILHRIREAEVVFLAGDIPPRERSALLQHCYENRRDVLCKAGLQEILLSSARQVILDDAPFLAIDAVRITPVQRVIKRGMDIVLSALLLMVLSPLLLAVGVIIRLSDGGPALFSQERLTVDGRRFTIRKFRTMRLSGAAATSATVGDARITRIGRFLRRWRIDELPQLINILAGDMSLVGPRPEMIENIERYKAQLPTFAYREKMKAGLTGYAQIEGRYNTTPEDKLMLDLKYIEGFSLWEDIKLLLRTLTVFFKPDSTEGFEE